MGLSLSTASAARRPRRRRPRTTTAATTAAAAPAAAPPPSAKLSPTTTTALAATASAAVRRLLHVERLLLAVSFGMYLARRAASSVALGLMAETTTPTTTSWDPLFMSPLPAPPSPLRSDSLSWISSSRSLLLPFLLELPLASSPPPFLAPPISPPKSELRRKVNGRRVLASRIVLLCPSSPPFSPSPPLSRSFPSPDDRSLSALFFDFFNGRRPRVRSDISCSFLSHVTL